MSDKEWEDGDDSALEDSAYEDGFAKGADWGAEMVGMYVAELRKRMKHQTRAQYRQGVMDAYIYVIDELGLDISDSDLLERHGVSNANAQ